MTGFAHLTALTVDPADPAERRRIREVLSRVARPRLAGTAGAAEVDAYLKGELEGLGYEVRELPFRFSTLPGRFGVPAAGVVLLVCGIASAGLAARHQGAAALGVYAAGALLIALGAAYAGRLIAGMPIGRIQAANWLVTQPGARPRVLLVAHRDSKSQAVPLYVRAASIAVAIVAALACLLLALAALLGPATIHLLVPAILVALACAAAGTVLVLCRAGNASPGALDNASGVAALVGVARRERGNPEVGFLFTDAEELGLAGASAACLQLHSVGGIINVDGLDDAGDFHVIERHGFPRRGMAPHLVAALLAGAHALGVPARRRPLPLGVLLDHVPLVNAGFPAVTLMRGTRDSLKRVHLPQDDLERLTGEGAAEAVPLLSGALAFLRARSAAA